jgi:plasmid stabilization system protein ParE
MIYGYILQEEAQREYEISVQWYLERSERAATNFILAVDAALQLICKYPQRWRNKYKNYYELGLKKYPFTIIYTIETDKQLIFITAIYHHKRSPGKRYRKK